MKKAKDKSFDFDWLDHRQKKFLSIRERTYEYFMLTKRGDANIAAYHAWRQRKIPHLDFAVFGFVLIFWYLYVECYISFLEWLYVHTCKWLLLHGRSYSSSDGGGKRRFHPGIHTHRALSLKTHILARQRLKRHVRGPRGSHRTPRRQCSPFGIRRRELTYCV